MEAIKRLSGILPGAAAADADNGSAASLVGRLVVIDALTMQFRSLNVRKDPDCPLCGPHASIRTIEPERYAGGCAPTRESADTTDHPEEVPEGELPLELDVVSAAKMAENGAVFLDVREPFELGICGIARARHIPMRQVPEHLDELPRDRPVLVFCHHGPRSLRVTHFLREHGFPKAANMRGGIDAWAREIEPGMRRY